MVQPTTEGELAGQTKINFQTALFKDNHLSESSNKSMYEGIMWLNNQNQQPQFAIKIKIIFFFNHILKQIY